MHPALAFYALNDYKYEEDFGRMGSLSGMFVASDADVAAVHGKEVYLGEVLCKHSDITAIVDDDTLTMVSDDPAIVRFVQEHLDGGIGTNPIALYRDGE